MKSKFKTLVLFIAVFAIGLIASIKVEEVKYELMHDMHLIKSRNKIDSLRMIQFNHINNSIKPHENNELNQLEQ